MPFISKGPAPGDSQLAFQQDEARRFARANELLRRNAEIWWPHEIFLTSSQDVASHYPCPAVIDVSGKARHVVFGPFRSLPPGKWRASLVLRISAKAARRPLAVDLGAKTNFVAVSLPYGEPGLHRIDLEASFEAADDVQLRVWLKRAAFEGEIGFLGVALTSINVPSVEAASFQDFKAC